MRYSAKDYQVPETQRDILLNGSREDIIRWLKWNDPNGVWSDEDSESEGYGPISLEDAREAMRNALGGSLSDLKLVRCEPAS